MLSMTNKRVGKWAWSLSAQERLAAAVAVQAVRDKSDVASKALRLVYAAMLEKQKKLQARADRSGTPKTARPLAAFD